MTKMIIGVFDKAADAQASDKELIAAGCERSEIDVVGNRAESTLKLDALPNHIPEPDMHFYQKGVRQGGTLLIVTTDSRSAQEATDSMLGHEMVDVDARMRQYQQTNAKARLRDYDEVQGDMVLPVIEEELQVDKRQVERGRMRVYSRVSEHPIEEQAYRWR